MAVPTCVAVLFVVMPIKRKTIIIDNYNDNYRINDNLVKRKTVIFLRSLVRNVCVRIHRARVSAEERVQMRESPAKCMRLGRSGN